VLTRYDEEHIITYLRLLDANAVERAGLVDALAQRAILVDAMHCSGGFSPLKDPADIDIYLRACVRQTGAGADKGYRHKAST
jgi:hypothetical protein